MSYFKLFLCTWGAFALIMFLQSWSLAASVVPALLPTLISLASFALSALLANGFWYRALLSNLVIGFAFGISHFNIPENYTSSLVGKLLVYGGHQTQFGHLYAFLSYAVIVAGNLLGFIDCRYWMSRAASPGE
jgi:hypothetical protein